MTRSVAQVAAGHRLAMTDAPSGPAPTRRRTADFLLRFSNWRSRASAQFGRNLLQARTAGFCARRLLGVSLAAELSMARTLQRDRLDGLVGREGVRRAHQRGTHSNETAVLDPQNEVTVLQSAEPMRDYECGASLHQTFHRFDDGALGLHVHRASRL